MSVHVCILKKPYADAVLSGEKTVESRLTKTPMPPFDLIEPGERLFIKQSGGPFVATALAGPIQQFNDLTPERVDRLHEQHADTVGGDDAYWQGKRDSRFGVFIELREVEPMEAAPTYRPQSMRAWYVLPEESSPLIDLVTTAGGLRHHWVYLPAECRIRGHDGPVELRLPDGQRVETSVRGAHFRWRGWRPYFEAWRVRPGDRVRLIDLGAGRYRVTFPDARDAPDPD